MSLLKGPVLPPHEASRPPDRCGVSAGTPQWLLIVDDEPMIRLSLARALRRLGYTVAEANDGQVAIETLRSTPGIDGVVSDIRMPRLDGVELLHLVRAEKGPRRAFVLCTGDPSFLHSGERSVPDDIAILKKPFTVSLLAAALEDAFAAVGQRLPASGSDGSDGSVRT